MSHRQPISTFLGIAAAVVLLASAPDLYGGGGGQWGTINLSSDVGPCPTDIDGNGQTDVLDLIEVLLCFGLPAAGSCEFADVDGSGSVDVLDLIDVLLEFGQPCP